MSKSLAALIPSYKRVIAVVLLTMVGNVWSQNTILTEEDIALIEQGRLTSKNTSDLDMSLPLQNRHMNEAQNEAKEFFNQLQSTDKTLKEMQRRQVEKGAYTDHRMLVFASHSLGTQGLDDLLTAVSGQPDAVIVFRGIPDGMNLGQGVKAIQDLAAKKEPVPNIIINPQLFKTHNVTSVPTIIMLDGEQLLGQPPKVVAQVSGLADPSWLTREVDSGKTGDLGVKGPVEGISEPDLIDVAKARLVKIDWAEKKKQAIARFWSKQKFNELPKATKTRTREVDPSVVVTKDIAAADGSVFARAGEVINPLCDLRMECQPGTRPFTQAVVVFDPQDKKQMALLSKELPKIRQETGVQKVTFIATALDKEKGWDSYKSVSDQFDAPVYLLTPDLISRFELEHTPTVITAKHRKFIVRELAEDAE
ncbi:TrbC family F-type conjugative pilus assembly protein [Aeromonas veronii]|uniref:TrbC family F-type conjugative pilus assembly protein n=1 Tax=Aeromonas veronii TaxID=654 RepID=UPI003D222C6D